MSLWHKELWKETDGWPKMPTIFFLFAAFSLLQFPANFLVQKGQLFFGIVLNEWIFLFGGIWLCCRILKLPWKTVFHPKKCSRQSLYWLFILMIAMLIVIDYLTFIVDLVWPPAPAIKTFLSQLLSASSNQEILTKWLLLCVSPAICEEVVFRGFFQPAISRQWGALRALIVSALFFALMHGIPSYFLFYFLLGLLFGWLYFISRNLSFPILAHLINNTWTFGTHNLDFKIPVGGVWQPMDSFILILMLLIVTFSVRRFARPV